MFFVTFLYNFCMNVSAIVATAQQNVIGRNNQIPWYLPADLRYFKQTTLQHHVIMGRKCYESIGKPLPQRTNIVISRNLFFTTSGCLVARSVDEALEMAYDNGESEAFVIGGGEIYQQTVEFWDKIYVTEVDLSVPDGDIFFPNIAEKDWKESSRIAHVKDEKNEFDYVFRILERRI